MTGSSAWSGRRAGAALAPASYPGAPVVAFAAVGGARLDTETRGLIRADALWWPVARQDAVVASTLALDPGGSTARLAHALEAARRLAGRDAPLVLLTAPGRAPRVAARVAGRFDAYAARRTEEVRADRLTRAVADPTAGAALWLALGGVELFDLDGAPYEIEIPAGRFVDPWSGASVSAAQGLEIARFFQTRALRRRRPVATVGFSPWKRTNVTPFLSGPCGAPRHFRDAARARAWARRVGGEIALWGPSRATADALRAEGLDVLLIEDGFVRSVGLGVAHERPASLTVARSALHFETDRMTDFAAVARAAEKDPALKDRGRAAIARMRALGLSKYLRRADGPGATPTPPEAEGRWKLLVVGQVEGDASLRFGGGYPGGNLELARRARARRPEALLAYKPHPDVLSGLRAEPSAAEIAQIADVVLGDLDAIAAISWADEVETMTSQLGFEALLHDRPVVCHGRPFYAGFGLTEDLAPPRVGDVGGAVSLEALAAATLIAYPDYVSVGARIPCPAEVALDALSEARGRTDPVWSRLWKTAASQILNRLP